MGQSSSTPSKKTREQGGLEFDQTVIQNRHWFFYDTTDHRIITTVQNHDQIDVEIRDEEGNMIRSINFGEEWMHSCFRIYPHDGLLYSTNERESSISVFDISLSDEDEVNKPIRDLSFTTEFDVIYNFVFSKSDASVMFVSMSHFDHEMNRYQYLLKKVVFASITTEIAGEVINLYVSEHMVVDDRHNRLFASDWDGYLRTKYIRVFETSRLEPLFTIEITQFKNLRGLALDEISGHLFVGDGCNSKIHVYDANGSSGSDDSKPGQLLHSIDCSNGEPYRLAFDRHHRLLVGSFQPRTQTTCIDRYGLPYHREEEAEIMVKPAVGDGE